MLKLVAHFIYTTKTLPKLVTHLLQNTKTKLKTSCAFHTSHLTSSLLELLKSIYLRNLRRFALITWSHNLRNLRRSLLILPQHFAQFAPFTPTRSQQFIQFAPFTLTRSGHFVQFAPFTLAWSKQLAQFAPFTPTQPK